MASVNEPFASYQNWHKISKENSRIFKDNGTLQSLLCDWLVAVSIVIPLLRYEFFRKPFVSQLDRRYLLCVNEKSAPSWFRFHNFEFFRHNFERICFIIHEPCRLALDQQECSSWHLKTLHELHPMSQKLSQWDKATINEKEIYSALNL